MAETPVKEPPVEEKARTEEAPVKEEAPAEETKTEEKLKQPEKKKSKRGIIILLLLLLIGAAVVVYLRFFRETDDNRIPYAEGVVLQEDDEVEQVEKGWMKLTYNYKAFSNDGVIFSCLLTNDAANVYDMYFDIYADDTLEDRVYLSGLVRPGYGLLEIILDHELPVGTTTCYVVFNQVDTDEDGNQSIVNQMMVTVDFIVT